MGKTTNISWCDHTFNCWRGCIRVSPGCQLCYAERESKRFPDLRGVWGPAGTRVVAAERSWRDVLAWQAEARRDGVRRRVFCASLSDWLEDWPGVLLDHRGDTLSIDPEGRWYPAALGFVPSPRHRALTLDDVRARLLDLIARTPDLDWLLLSKRPENFDGLLRRAVASVPGSNGDLDGGVALGSAWLCGEPPRNVVLMTTAENQEYADLRVPVLLRTPAYRYGLSVEPQLGPVDLTPWLDRVHWVISGGESGPGARPFDLAWARSLRDQCGRSTFARFFLKQIGDNPVETCGGSRRGLPPCGRHGVDPEFWPDELRVQRFYGPVTEPELRAEALGKTAP